MPAVVYCNFHRDVRLGGWGSEGPTLGQYARVVCHHSIRKWKHIMKFEIRYFLEALASLVVTFSLTPSLSKVQFYDLHYI